MTREREIREAVQVLQESIRDYNDRYGYLGTDWERQVEERYDDNQSLSFDVYFENDIDVWVFLEAGSWNLANYLDQVTEIALEKAEAYLEEGLIQSLIPEFIEISF